LATANQFGSAFEPGSQIPVFGGPGGSVQLETDAGESAYLVPASWSPDGSMLVATIYSASSDRGSSPTESVELVTWPSADGSGPQSKRVNLAEADDARFLGWVVD
jgi:Tol biopolymer transport system component